jgi:hypothetical protein
MMVLLAYRNPPKFFGIVKSKFAEELSYDQIKRRVRRIYFILLQALSRFSFYILYALLDRV